VALTTCLHDTADFASRCINQEKTPVNLHELEEHAKKLDIARGNFQIPMVLNLDKSVPDADAFLRKRLELSNQSLPDDDECLKGTRAAVLRRAGDWLDNPELPNILWISGAPGAGKSAIATTLVNQFSVSGERLCAKVAAKRDIADRRDPKRVWRTLVYNLARLHAGLKGTIMEALSKKSPDFQNKFRDLIVEAVRACKGNHLARAVSGISEPSPRCSHAFRAS